MNGKYTVLILAVGLLFGAGLVRAEGLDTLIEVGKNQGEITKAYSEETRRYESIKRAIASGEIKTGATKNAILGKYGEPVVMVGDYGNDREKWVYKPATSDFGNGPRISLFFSKDAILNEISVEK